MFGVSILAFIPDYLNRGLISTLSRLGMVSTDGL